MLVLTNILTHYIYYYFFYKGTIDDSSNLSFTMIPLATIAPLIVYYYVLSVIYGKINFTVKSILHYVPILINTIIFILFLNSEHERQTLLSIAKFFLISLYIIYPFVIIRTLAKFYGTKGFSLKVFQFNRKKTTLIKLLLFMMVFHFLIMLIKTSLPFFIEGTEKVMDIINLCFLMLLGYAISYVIISEPKTIQLSEEKIGLSGFKKYKKSNLTRSDAESHVKTLNKVMENEKPYLDSEFNLAEFSKLSNIPIHTLSETLNGLIGQSFNDYVNNYRVEEFKKFALKGEFRKYTILALAFEAGFKSKATFNAAFKKFTGKTPSQFLKDI
ncbi:AraC family transcriptional regulator [uncultured Lutibacter sp.]|uniref:helix-turn-helix domain-containing protein n=1 Tax=uncultured Lutibacter sp. TaxID=437739 RepID=UPI00260B6BE4|nr:helix-turn-helix domain-containing protein [uncultured Lutibacter sp.]